MTSFSRKRRDFLKTAALSTVALMTPGCEGVLESIQQEKKKKPNVLVIFDDQLRADACSVYGGRNIQTPQIDRMAAEGVRFTNGLSTCPLCTPYRGMLQTGRYPTHSGLILNWFEVNPNQPCIAHVFKDAGYDTGFIGKWHLAAGSKKTAGKFAPNQKAIEEYCKQNPEHEFVPPGPDRLGYDYWAAFNFHCEFNNFWYYRDEPEKIYTPEYETDAEINLAIDYMEKHKNSERPFFLMVAPHPPHNPFKPEYCPDGYLGKIKEDLYFSPNVPENHPRRKDQLNVRCYYAMCKNVDDNIGRIMAFLDKSGMSEDTIVVFTSDHGEQHGSHNKIHKMVPYTESVNVPLIIRRPGHVPSGVVRNDIYTPLDHMATLTSLCGLDSPHTCDGIDMSSAVMNTGSINRDAALMMSYTSHWDYFQTQTLFPEWRGLHTGQFTYAKWLSGKEELFDNMVDPWQMNNLADGQKDLSLLKKMRLRLKDLLADAHDDFLPGTEYANWYDDRRNLIRTALGPV